MTSADARHRAYLAWAGVCLVWGTTFLAIKVALETVPPFAIGTSRYLLAGGALALIVRARGIALPPPRTWPGFVLLGFLMFGLGNGSIVWAEQFVPSGLTAVIMATGPFWMVGVEAALPGGERLTARHILGLALGFAGVVLLVGPQMTGHGTTDWRLAAGLVVLQVGCAGWALGSSYFLRRMRDIDPFASAAMQMIAGGLVMAVMSFAAGERLALDASLRSVTAIVYLALAGATAGFAFYMFALKHLPVSFVGLYAYVNPVIAVALGTLLLGERFDWRMAGGVTVILAGMAVVTSKSAARRSVEPTVIQGPRPIDCPSPASLRKVS